MPSVPPDAPLADLRTAWDPKRVNAVFDPEGQCEPSDILYKFCFTDYDQRWVQMEALNLDHHALHEDHPIRPGLLSQISNHGDPRKTAVYVGWDKHWRTLSGYSATERVPTLAIMDWHEKRREELALAPGLPDQDGFEYNGL